MRILVTGGAGFIGSATTQALLDAGHQVTVYDNLSKGHRAAVPTAAQFVHGDIGDRSQLAAVFAAARFDAVLHFASLIEAGELMQQPARYFRQNVAFSNNVIEAAQQSGCSRFVLSSTAAVYAGSDTPLTESSPLAPANLYGATKLMIEQMLAWYQQTVGLRYAVLRYFNAAGAMPNRGEAHSPETHLIPNVLKVPLGQREKLFIYGTDYPTPDGTCIRDYIHIADLASAHVLAVEALTEHHQLTYNIGTGRGYSIRELLTAAEAVTGQRITAEEQPRRAGDAPRLVADASKIQRELGWQAAHSSLDEILRSAWAWHRQHPHGYY